MDGFLWLVSALVVAWVATAIIYALVKNIWVRVAWRLGYPPKILDKEMFLLTVGECSDVYTEGWRQHYMECYVDEPDLEDAARLHKQVADYTAWAIQRYIQNFVLPRHNLRKGPKLELTVPLLDVTGSW